MTFDCHNKTTEEILAPAIGKALGERLKTATNNTEIPFAHLRREVRQHLTDSTHRNRLDGLFAKTFRDLVAEYIDRNLRGVTYVILPRGESYILQISP